MSNVALLQQYGDVLLKGTKRALERYEDAWQWWSAEYIASVVNCPVESVRVSWPLLWAALVDWGIGTYNVSRGVIGTTAIETAHTFMPVREAFWLSEEWRAANLRYYPWYGRGYIQLTWESNYRYFGAMIGVDLTSNPDRAMDPLVAAQVMAAFCKVNGVADAFEREDWREGRRLVQGADAGLGDLINFVNWLRA